MAFARYIVNGGSVESSQLRFVKASIAMTLMALLAAPMAQAVPVQEPQSGQQNTSRAQAPVANPQNSPEAPVPQLADPATRSGNQQTDQQNTNPVGTAAAPVAKPTGVAASRPAGAVIAPAKQRRVRAIVIRVGIIVGAGVAIGTVAALSRSNSGRP